MARAIPFWERVDKSGGPDACWLWLGYRDKLGYGTLLRHGTKPRKFAFAHRVALELTRGLAAEGELACHHCDNPTCCNPAHLYWGTPKDNSDDKATRGRMTRGAACHQAKLSEAQVLELRARRADGETLASLSAAFGVCTATVHYITRGITWKHLLPAAANEGSSL